MLDFDEIKHSYSLDGTQLPSVSDILNHGIGNKWVCVDRWYADRGTSVHNAIRYYHEGTLDTEALNTYEFAGYVHAFLRFCKDTGFKHEECEKQLASETYCYAGTLDAIGGLVLADWKTSKSFNDRYRLQTAGYQILAAENGIDVLHRLVVLLNQNGEYRVKEYEDPADIDEFIEMRNAYNGV